MPESEAIEMIPLTIMSDIDGIARSQNGENAGVIKASGILGVVLDLDAKTERVSTQVCHVTRRVIHPGTIEGWLRASGVGDGEGILGEGMQGSAGIVEQFEGLPAGVDDGHGDLQV